MSTVTLPDEVFQLQICSGCYQYLSYPPVTVTKLGEKICGRCVPSLKRTNAKKVFAQSLFNGVMEHVQFQCVNHFDGCKQLLGIKDVEDHEKLCKFEKRKCFYCSFLGNNWSQILNHCKAVHSEGTFEDGKLSFVLNLGRYNGRFVLVVGNSILSIAIAVRDEKFTAVIECANNENNELEKNHAATVKFFVPTRESDFCVDYLILDCSSTRYFEKQLSELTSRFGSNARLCCQFVVKKFSISEWDLELERKCILVNKLEVSLLEKEKQIEKERASAREQCKILEKQIETERALVREQTKDLLSLKNVVTKLAMPMFICQKCKNRMTSDNINICPKYHSYCQNCLTGVCAMCNASCQFSKLPPDFSNLRVSCDWHGCPENQVLIHAYVEHKHYCKFRPFKCPLKNCSAVLYSSQGLKDHWHSAIPALKINDESIVCDKYGDFEYYWFVDNDLYHFLIDFKSTSLNIYFESIDNLKEVPSFKCMGYDAYKRAWIDHGVFKNFVGRMQLISTNRYSYFNGSQYTEHSFGNIKICHTYKLK